VALVVEDHQREEVASWKAIEQIPGFKIGVASRENFEQAQKILPETEIVQLDSYEEFFSGHSNANTIVISAEAGSAWTILHPQYTVAIPEPHFTRPVAIAMAPGDQAFLNFINAWLQLKKTTGEIDRLYNIWILGKDDEQKKPRWSVIRNLLHWVD
jgi:ABC-type amino acid transport substrate-binding protein